ncbi:hypothetical protein FJY63_12725, partial [Candidatus Sumerlaeota bacterium]|nr:hypothetical protein [Candidatus Sumerlaeota bacterium]
MANRVKIAVALVAAALLLPLVSSGYAAKAKRRPPVRLGPIPLTDVRGSDVRGSDVRGSGRIAEHELQSLRLAIRDLSETFGSRYPNGQHFLAHLDDIEKRQGSPAVAREFYQLKQEALLSNPLLGFGRLILVKRAPQKFPRPSDRRISTPPTAGADIGMPSNHECNSSLPRIGYDNEIAVLSPVRPDGKLTTLYRPANDGYVGEIDLHYDGSRLLFSHSDATNWKVWEMRADGSALRQVSQMPDDVDCFDACYLPDGGIVFGCTASYQAVPCWHGMKVVTNIYRMNGDGSGVRQLCFDQDHDFHPSVAPDGQVVFHRWDYTGIGHIFLRELMAMNPDGTGQRAIYGSNSWYPNSLYFPRALPGSPGKIVCILSGYHGVHRMGQLVVVDTNRGWQSAEGLVLRISGRNDPINPIIRDELVDPDWPKFLHPYPLSDKYFLVSCWMGNKANWAVYLADVFDNLVLVREEPGYALLEPVPLMKTPAPPLIPDRVDRSRKDAIVYLHRIYEGPGLSGVPPGIVRKLRVLAYDFAYRDLAGPDLIGYGGPWEVMRILGTVPLEEDGSAMFRIPANTPVAVQALDSEGRAVQLMP